MTLILPQPVPAAAGWQLADFRPRVVLTSPPAAGGKARAEGPQLGVDELWLIDHMVCSITAPGQLRLYDSQEGPGFLLDGTETGSFDVADWPTGLQLAPSGFLLAVWTGVPDGAVGTIAAQVRVMRQVGG